MIHNRWYQMEYQFLYIAIAIVIFHKIPNLIYKLFHKHIKFWQSLLHQFLDLKFIFRYHLEKEQFFYFS